jgi:signal transduction histidine kinase
LINDDHLRFRRIVRLRKKTIADAGGVVTVKSQLGEDGQIEISVNDTGPGLPLGKADQIFDAFFTTKPQGSPAPHS